MQYENKNYDKKTFKKRQPRYQGDDVQQNVIKLLKDQAYGYINGDPIDKLFNIENGCMPIEGPGDLLFYMMERRIKSDKDTGEYMNMNFAGVIIANESACPRYYVTANCNWRNGFQSYMACTKIGEYGPLPKEVLRGMVKEQKDE